MSFTQEQLSELETFFKNSATPASVQLDSGVKITDIPTFIESHFAVLKHSGYKPVYEAFYFRLLLLKEILGPAKVAK